MHKQINKLWYFYKNIILPWPSTRSLYVSRTKLDILPQNRVQIYVIKSSTTIIIIKIITKTILIVKEKKLFCYCKVLLMRYTHYKYNMFTD